MKAKQAAATASGSLVVNARFAGPDNRTVNRPSLIAQVTGEGFPERPAWPSLH